MNNIESYPEFDDHKFLSCLHDNKSGLCAFVAIHRGNTLRPAFGATRILNYESSVDAVRDAMRLARTMSYKSALAGLKYGGAKGVIFKMNGVKNKKELLKAYAKGVNYLGGHFITGADVGISKEDVKVMRRHSRYMVGVKTDPVRYTTLGLIYSIEVGLKEIFGSETFSNRTFAIQGVGKIGEGILSKIYKDAKKIYVADVDNSVLKNITKKYPKVVVVKPTDIHKQNVDLFSPCALSSAVNKNNVKDLHCQLVIGGANNQLDSDKTGEILHKKGILYGPDYVVNAGGLISVVDEYENNSYRIKRVTKRVMRIKTRLKRIISSSKRQSKPISEIADSDAKRIVSLIN